MKGAVIPPFIAVLTTWHFDPAAALLLVAAGVLYALGIRSAARAGHRWPVSTTLLFYVVGLGSYAVVSFGILGAYTYDLRWAFATRLTLLLIGVPWFFTLGKPVALAEAALGARGRARLTAFFESRFMRATGNAIFEPLFTLAILMLLVTPFAAFMRESPISQTLISVVIPLVGFLQVTPIMEATRRHTSIAITYEFMIAFAALIFDAVPAILIRLHTVVLDGLPTLVGSVPYWFPSAIRDQQLQGDILWFLAETADVPVLIILFIRWTRIDKRETREIDSLSDEEMEALTQAHLRGRQ